MNTTFKYFIVILSIAIFGLAFFLLTLKTPIFYSKKQKTIHSCIQQDKQKLHFRFRTPKGVYFDVNFVRNAKLSCINPNFPAIHIKTNRPHQAWLQVVYTDSKSPHLQAFVDSTPSSSPFYTKEKDFYDAPLWTYSLLSRPLSFWKAHTFAIEIKSQTKTIKCLGGIEWGFELPFMKRRPVAIEPQLLNEKAWVEAWRLIKDKLPRFISSENC